MVDLQEKIAMAEKLTGLGLPLFLVKPMDKKPLRAGWQKEATTDAQIIADQLRLNPEANLGVATGGATRLLVVDIDPRHGGDTSLDAIEGTSGKFPQTFTVQTGGGGRHFYFRLPNDVKAGNTAGRLGSGIDIRGNGGLVVAPGSIHPSGTSYTIAQDAALAVAPEWLLSALANRKSPDKGAGRHDASTSLAAKPFTEGRRNTDLFSLAGLMRRKGADEATILGALKGANTQFPTPLADEEVAALASGVMRYEASEFFSHTERSLAEEFSAANKGCLAYAPEFGWLHYEAGAWRSDAGGQHAQERAKEFVQALEARAQAAAACERDSQKADKIIKAALRWQRATVIGNLIKLAQSDPAMLVQAQEFDCDSHLLNLRNGTLDLRTITLRPHSPSDHLRRQAHVHYDPAAACPQFDRFLARILGTEKTGFLMRAFAYSLLGQPREQKLFILTGAGRNGKTTLTELVREMLGDYAIVLDPSSLLRKNAPTIGNDIARLNGARFAITSEFSRGAIIDIPLVKKLTGNESIAARFLYREAFEFDAKAVFFLVSNHTPVIDGADMALSRRLVVVPFDVVIPESEVDQDLKEKLTAERAGIFNKLLSALADYQTVRLQVPDTIQTTTDQYVLDHDVVAQFMLSECKIGPSSTVRAHALYARYKSYCLENSLQPMCDRIFKKTVESKGYSQRRVSAGLVWQGFEISSLPERLRAA